MIHSGFLTDFQIMTRSAIRSQMDLNSEIRLGFQMGFQMPIRLETLKLRDSNLAIRWDSLKPMDLNSDFRSEIQMAINLEIRSGIPRDSRSPMVKVTDSH